VLQYIHKELDPTGGKTVLEIGSGTGIFSRLLLQPPTAEYPSFDLGKLVAVEPSAGMRAAWDRGQARLPASATANATTVDGGFDDLSHAGITKGIADAVIIAQAWHWCPDYDKALREIASYLRPDTPLFLVWNLEFNADPWHRRIRDLYQPLDLGSPQYYRGLWKAMFDTNAYKELYEPVHDEHLPWDMGMNEDQLVDRLFSKSYLTEAHLNGDKRVQFEKELRKAIQEGNKEWIDKEASGHSHWSLTMAEGHLQVQVRDGRLCAPPQVAAPVFINMSAS
jgi:SAM-dependent methyltransferase